MSSINYEWSTILITGGGGGLGLALAKYFISKGKTVILAGRTESNLSAAVAEIDSSNVSYFVVDFAKVEELPAFVALLLQKHPNLDAVLNNAGIAKWISYADATDANISSKLSDVDVEITTNITAVVHLTTLLLPHLLSKPKAAIISVSSGLAFVPISMGPTYCASKAYIYSWTMALRKQLSKTNVRVLDIVPPAVESNLARDTPFRNKKMPGALSQEQFIEEVDQLMMEGKDEIAVGTAGTRSKLWHGAFDEWFQKMNP